MDFEVDGSRLSLGTQHVRWDASPHHSGSFSPRGIIVHDTAGRLDKFNSCGWFKNPKAKASAHFVVERDGTVTQMVELNRRAWHAGKSIYKGHSNVNAFAFGIEIVNLGRCARIGADAYKTWFKKVYRNGEDGLLFSQVDTPNHGKPGGYWHDYTEEQILSVHGICKCLTDHFGLEFITCHWFISPGRKVDTNPLFPIEELRQTVFGESDLNEHEEAYLLVATNMRRWPSYAENVIRVIPKGERVPVIRSGTFDNPPVGAEDWHLVEYDGQEGWVNGGLVQL